MNTRVPFDSRVPDFWAIINTIGHAALVETLRSAAYYVTYSNGLRTRSHDFTMRITEASSCFAYVQGTGLNILIERFGLAYDADILRDNFNYLIRQSA